MQEVVVERTSEFSNVIASVISEFYLQAAPRPLAERLARLHENAWDAIMSGGSAISAFVELRLQAGRIFNADELIDSCNEHVVWELTPVIAATIACAPGEDRVSLRMIGEALTGLVESALAGAGERLSNETDLRAAA